MRVNFQILHILERERHFIFPLSILYNVRLFSLLHNSSIYFVQNEIENDVDEKKRIKFVFDNVVTKEN